MKLGCWRAEVDASEDDRGRVEVDEAPAGIGSEQITEQTAGEDRGQDDGSEAVPLLGSALAVLAGRRRCRARRDKR